MGYSGNTVVIHVDFRSQQILISLRRIPALESRSMCGLRTGASMVISRNKYSPRQVRTETRHKTAGAQGQHKISGFNTYPGLILSSVY